MCFLSHLGQAVQSIVSLGTSLAGQPGVLGTKAEQRVRVGRLVEPNNFITGRPKAGSLVALDVVCGCLLFFLVDIK